MPDLAPLPRTVIEPIVRRALDEDFGVSGDLSANLLVPAKANGSLVMRAREAGVIAGMQAAKLTYELVDPTVDFKIEINDGGAVKPGDIIARVKGPSRSLLSAARTARGPATSVSTTWSR